MSARPSSWRAPLSALQLMVLPTPFVSSRRTTALQAYHRPLPGTGDAPLNPGCCSAELPPDQLLLLQMGKNYLARRSATPSACVPPPCTKWQACYNSQRLARTVWPLCSDRVHKDISSSPTLQSSGRPSPSVDINCLASAL